MTSPSSPTLPAFLLDTGPLSVLCGFPLSGTPFLHTILPHAAIVLADGVTGEVAIAKTGKIARVVSPLLETGTVTTINAPLSPSILDSAYGKLLGLGERSTIRAGVATGLTAVIDDKDAFIVACRFGVQPVGFQDFIVRLATEYTLPRQTAVEIVKATARQFPAAYLTHTLDLLA